MLASAMADDLCREDEIGANGAGNLGLFQCRRVERGRRDRVSRGVVHCAQHMRYFFCPSKHRYNPPSISSG